jgi:hypothetical protein
VTAYHPRFSTKQSFLNVYEAVIFNCSRQLLGAVTEQLYDRFAVVTEENDAPPSFKRQRVEVPGFRLIVRRFRLSGGLDPSFRASPQALRAPCEMAYRP